MTEGEVGWTGASTPLSEIRAQPAPAQRDGRKYTPDSDADLVERFVEACGETHRYVGETRRWMIYTGARWEEDTGARVIEDVKAVCREAANEQTSLRDARALESDFRIAAIERLSRSHPSFRARADQWDRDPLLLNTPDGTVDLRNGKARAPQAGDYITRMTAVARDEDADHPIWTKVLNRALPDGRERAYLQRFAGYCLSGVTTAHALLVAYGAGANSKNVILGTIKAVMGDYATSAAAETFLAAKHDRHPAELAVLRGARLVLASEIDEGRSWNTMLINRITGGDPLIARVMRGDPFEFIPEFKLIALTNHMPAVRGVNEATRRRFNVLHFGVTIPKQERDPELLAKLKPEWPAILRWLIDGAVNFREVKGLLPPESVQLSTADYLDAENEIEDWLAECTERTDPDTWTTSADLFRSWSAWAKRAGGFVGSQKRLAATLKQIGYRHGHNQAKTARVFYGLRIVLPLANDGDREL